MLRLAPGLELPLDAVTQPIGIVARRGAGKTYCGSVLTEELVTAGLQVVVLDPQGVWWGLRSSADGKGDGIPITIIGGEHGDIPLEETAGRIVADLVIDNPGSSFIIDVSSFESDAEQDRFALDFAARLYRGKVHQKSPLMLVVDEADSFAPQNPLPNQRKMLGAFEAIVKRGRVRGLGICLITQRIASLNKNVFNQSELLILLQLTGPQDRKAVSDWIIGHATENELKRVMSSLASLGVGDAWFWSPQWLGILQKIHVRRRRTFDSSRTPAPGEIPVEPRKLAPVELDAVRAAMKATIEKAELNDPERLRKQVATLRVELATEKNLHKSCNQDPSGACTPHAPIEVEVEKVVEVQVPVFEPGSHLVLADAVAQANDLATSLLELVRAAGGPAIARPAPAPATVAKPVTTVTAPAAASPHVQDAHRRVQDVVSDDDVKLGKAEKMILSVLAQYPQGRTKTQVALLTGYASGGGSFNNALGRMRTLDFITGKEILSITPNGLVRISNQLEPLPAAGVELLDYWRAKLGKAGKLILTALADAYPESLTKDEVAARTGYAPGGGSYNNMLGRLRTLELIEGKAELRISPDLMG